MIKGKALAYDKHFTTELEELGKVAVLYGGVSAERSISLKSGQAVIRGLTEIGINVNAIDINENIIEQLTSASFDTVFIALHGVGGEDGRVQALLEYLDKPYTGSGLAASALALDKLKSKQIWQTEGLVTPPYASVTADTDWQEVMDVLGVEVFVKPIHEGSSLGMSYVDNAEALKEAYQLAATFEPQVLVEQRIVGPEYSVALLNGQALPPIRMLTSNSFYDYQAKYESNETRYQCPCDLSATKVEEIQSIALKAFKALGCSGWGRIDFMQNIDGDFFLLEANTVPGMTEHSLVPMAAKAVGLSFNDLLLEILASAQAMNKCR